MEDLSTTFELTAHTVYMTITNI